MKGEKTTMKETLKNKTEKVGGFVGEFKKFITRGNVMDMAVGVIIGGAFTAIVTSLNEDILSPIISLVGGTDFSYLQIAMGSGDNAPVLMYGKFITAVINFLITSFVIFLIIKGINHISDRFSKDKEAEEEATEKDCPFCMSKIDIKATRCPHCTSQLPEEETLEEEIVEEAEK